MTTDIRIAVEAPDRRGLLARLCAELGRALAGEERWERDDVVVPWHASAGTFERLPERMIVAILAEWEETDACLAGIEFSGYLETDRGPRAWGSLMVHEGRQPVLRAGLASCMVEEVGDGGRLEARLVARVHEAERRDD